MDGILLLWCQGGSPSSPPPDVIEDEILERVVVAHSFSFLGAPHHDDRQSAGGQRGEGGENGLKPNKNPPADRRKEELLERLAHQVAGRLGYEVEAIKFSLGGRSGLVRVTLDAEQGVSHADCARFSNGFNQALEEEGSIENDYTLEVSSPGLFRPFSELKHYRRNLNRKVEIQLKEPVEGKHQLTGKLKDADEASLVLVLDGGREQRVPMELVRKATRALEL